MVLCHVVLDNRLMTADYKFSWRCYTRTKRVPLTTNTVLTLAKIPDLRVGGNVLCGTVSHNHSVELNWTSHIERKIMYSYV